jgi:ABC-type glycerol-3-phosphate transport system substrate-binding protein
MRRLWFAVGVALILVFGLVSLGATQEKVTIRWLFETDFGGGWKVLIEQFEKLHPNIDVEMQEGPSATNVRSS